MVLDYNNMNLFLLTLILSHLTQCITCDVILDQKLSFYNELLQKVRDTKPNAKSSEELQHLLKYKISGRNRAEYIGDLEGMNNLETKEIKINISNPETLLPD